MKPKIKNTEITEAGFYSLRHDLLEHPSGSTLNYTSLLLPPAVVILAQTPLEHYIVNREHRYPIGRSLLGPPGGRLEPEEEVLVGAQRELYEETGYWSEELTLIGSCHPFPGICNQKIFYVWAKNAREKGGQHLDPFEWIQVELKSDQELREALKKEEYVDGNLCIALWYKDHFC